MPNPKKRHSVSRGRKRRTHYKATVETFAVCPTTGETHLWHRAYWHDGVLYYKGSPVMEKQA